jgi:hypothetical protein
MSEIEHTRTLEKVYQYSNTKILLLAGVINRLTTADAGDVLLRIEYSADLRSSVLLRRRIMTFYTDITEPR